MFTEVKVRPQLDKIETRHHSWPLGVYSEDSFAGEREIGKGRNHRLATALGISPHLTANDHEGADTFHLLRQPTPQ